MQAQKNQYLSIKAKYPDAIVLFRSGDLYESFGTDAKLVAHQLGIRLSKLNDPDLNCKASFPCNCLDNYLHTLVKKGNEVALCEQLVNPKKIKRIAKKRPT